MGTVAMSLAYQQLLNQISAKHKAYGEHFQPACGAKELAELETRAREELGIDIPPGYAQFLLQQNGFNWNGLFIYASKTIPIVGYKDRFIVRVHASGLLRDEAADEQASNQG